MIESYVDHMIHKIKKWAKKPGADRTLDPSTLTDLTTIVIRSVYDHQYAPLDVLRNELTPIAANFYDWIREIPEPQRQAMKISLLSDVVRGSLFIMEHDDPKRAASLIPKGEIVLDILTRTNKEEMGIEHILKHWPEELESVPSPSTISRVLGALEEAGFLQRVGATKGRKLRLLPKAELWREITGETEKAETAAKLPVETPGPGVSYSNRVSTPKSRSRAGTVSSVIKVSDILTFPQEVLREVA